MKACVGVVLAASLMGSGALWAENAAAHSLPLISLPPSPLLAQDCPNGVEGVVTFLDLQPTRALKTSECYLVDINPESPNNLGRVIMAETSQAESSQKFRNKDPVPVFLDHKPDKFPASYAVLLLETAIPYHGPLVRTRTGFKSWRMLPPLGWRFKIVTYVEMKLISAQSEASLSP